MREAFSQTRKHPLALAISSGKGGVGKTFLAIHLAARAAERGRRVLLLDADLGLANVDVMLGITPRGDIEQVLGGRTRMDDIIVSGVRGFDVLPGGSGLHQLTRLTPERQTLLLDHMNALTENYDLVLIDTPAGIGENVLFFSSCAEAVLIVLTPDPTSLTDAYALIKVLSRQRNVDRFMVAVNQADATTAQITFRRLLSVSDRYLNVMLEFVGCMPEHEEVRAAIRAQKLLREFADQARTNEINPMLDTILEQPGPVHGHGGLQLFWQRALDNSLGRSASSAGQVA